jgi:Hypothetical glycosyl hydrolase family 15/Carbohydrate binding domain
MRPRRPALLVGLLTLATLWVASPRAAVAARAFPRMALYGSVVGGGYPYTINDGPLDTLEIARAARFGDVVLDVYPINPYRPDIVAAIRARNPRARLFGYVLATHIWAAGDADSTRHIPTLIRRTVRDLDGFLYDRATGQEYKDNSINIAKKVNGRYVVAEALADLFRDRILATGVWDGLFVDVYCHGIAWTQNGTGQVIDLARAGYANTAELDAAWGEACDTLAARLRRDAGPTFVLVGNCAASAEHATFNGWMRENFPYQQGGTWASNMLGDVSSRGYFQDDRDYQPESFNWILSFGNTTVGQENSSANNKRVRYGLGSASLGEGVHAIGPGAKSVREAMYQRWWYDEYAVDLVTGRSSESQAHTGWLGEALGPARKMMWASGAADAVTNAGFESSVTDGWVFRSFAPAQASLVRDAGTAAVGTSSAKVSVTTPSTVNWHCYLSSAGQLDVQAGLSYAATFWCKASGLRTVHVLAGNSGGQAYVAVDTTWRQYQVVMTPTQSMAASLTFFLGLEAGDVWFDDVHFQQGATSVWRRDFHNGIVLVNPTETPLDVTLEEPFKRLIGTHEPTLNDGRVGNVQRVEAFDALFLLRPATDDVPPAGVRDLRVGP